MKMDLYLNNYSTVNRPANRVYQEKMDALLFRPLELLLREKPYLFENGFALLALELQFFEPHGRLLAQSIKGPFTSRQYFDLAFNDFLFFLERSMLLKPEVRVRISELKIFKLTRGRVFGDMANISGFSIDTKLGKISSAECFFLENGIVLVNPWNFVEALKLYFNNFIESERFLID